MISDELRARIRGTPFKPFTVVTIERSRIHIPPHDHAWVLPSGGELYVEEAQGMVHWIYTSHISELAHEEPSGETPQSGASARP